MFMDIGSEEFMARRKQELMDRIGPLDGGDRMHGPHASAMRRSEFDGENIDTDVGAEEEEEGDMPIRKRHPLDRMVHDLPPRHFEGQHEGEEGRHPRDRKPHGFGEDSEIHPNPQIQAKIDAMRTKRNVRNVCFKVFTMGLFIFLKVKHH
jgi:hypothetical protein